MTAEHLTTTFIAREMGARGYLVVEGPARQVRGGTADSRRVAPGDVFVAFKGEHEDGNRFVVEALAAGAVAAICERAPDVVPAGRTVVVAPSATRAAAELARAWRRDCGPRVVAITGTVGKTTAKDLAAAALGQRFRVHSSPGNLNSREGLPLALMSLQRGDEVSVLEMGMDSPGEIAELCAVAEPETGVVLNIGLTHVSKLGSIEAIAEEKLSLARSLPGSGTAVLNADDDRIAGAAGIRCRVISFGAGQRAALRRGEITSRGLEGTAFPLSWHGETVTTHCHVPGAHVVPGAMAAVGVCLALGMGLGEAAAALDAAEVDGRVRVVPGAAGAVILDDRYNSSPASLEGALRLLGGLPGRRIALVGKMAELGEHEEEEHRKAGATAAAQCDLLFVVGEAGAVMAEAAREAGLQSTHWFAEKEEAARAVRALLGPGDHVLVKASRGQAFETIIPILEGAG